MSSKFCDLHTHSCFSDGTCTPAEIVELAVSSGLSAVALTDHNTVEGLPSFLNAAKEQSIRAIPGVEISADFEGTELHIVGLFLKPADFDAVSGFLAPFLAMKEESNRSLVAALNRAGFRLDYEAICREHPKGTVNRAVIAAAMVEKGYLSTVREGFQGVLSKKSGNYLPPRRPDALETIAFLRFLDAAAVLAHPFLNLKTEEALRAFLNAAVPRGLAAMETIYPAFSPETALLARNLAREYGLSESGGSDFHGAVKPHIRLGSPAVPLSFADSLNLPK